MESTPKGISTRYYALLLPLLFVALGLVSSPHNQSSIVTVIPSLGILGIYVLGWIEVVRRVRSLRRLSSPHPQACEDRKPPRKVANHAARVSANRSYKQRSRTILVYLEGIGAERIPVFVEPDAPVSRVIDLARRRVPRFPFHQHPLYTLRNWGALHPTDSLAALRVGHLSILRTYITPLGGAAPDSASSSSESEHPLFEEGSSRSLANPPKPVLKRVIRKRDNPNSLLDAAEGREAEARAASKRKRTSTDPKLSSSKKQKSDEASSVRPEPNEHNGREVIAIDDDAEERTPLAEKTLNRGTSTKGKEKAPMAAPSQIEVDVLGPDGLLIDLDNIDIDIPDPSRRRNAKADLENFFGNAVLEGGKKRHKCNLCKKYFVGDYTTRRRHMDSVHRPKYQKWAKQNDFMSMLPSDVQARNKAQAESAATASLIQTALDEHLQPMEKVTAYSDSAFREASTSWIIATDQSLRSLRHPTFIRMIEIASRAKNGVIIPSGKATRQEILDMFYKHIHGLRKTFNSAMVPGRISLTCDCWQASNVDAYLAVTAHWVDLTPNVPNLSSALIGFTRLNNAHHGVRLGQALFKVVERVGISEKVFKVTCDNAANNDTMLTEFARLLSKKTGKIFDSLQMRIRCLAHIINLATQALIKAHTKAEYYNPQEPDAHIPDNTNRDEIGIIRAISVKERSSSQRKELFKKSQELVNDRNGAGPSSVVSRALTLILDMPVRWSSTFNMLRRSLQLRKAVDRFILELHLREKNESKRQKLAQLSLTGTEWQNVNLFCKLLQIPDRAQQQFSSEKYPALYLGIPALEALHSKWTKRLNDIAYNKYYPGIQAALTKIEAYYNLTCDNEAFLFSMMLHPEVKMKYVESHWDSAMQEEAWKTVQNTFKERFVTLSSSLNNQSLRLQTKKSRSFLDDSDDEDATATNSSLSAPTGTDWELEFKRYINTKLALPPDCTVLQWWKLHMHDYPVWASLAWDYLPVMASSVSSERAFSGGGLTLVKRRNRLHGDVMEALQGLKCALREELLIREEVQASADAEMKEDDDSGELDTSEALRVMSDLTIELDSDCDEEV